MSLELVSLALAAVLWAGQLMLMAVRANLEVGTAYFLSSRDGPPPKEPSAVTLRLRRAYENHIEALLLFAVAVTVLTLAGKENGLTGAMALVYLGARALYVPAYALDWVPLRSVIWAIGFFATLIILVVAILP